MRHGVFPLFFILSSGDLCISLQNTAELFNLNFGPFSTKKGIFCEICGFEAKIRNRNPPLKLKKCGLRSKNFHKNSKFCCQANFWTIFWHSLNSEQPKNRHNSYKLFDRQPSNFTTILPLSSSNKKIVWRICLKWIVTEILMKIKIFIRKRSP